MWLDESVTAQVIKEWTEQYENCNRKYEKSQISIFFPLISAFVTQSSKLKLLKTCLWLSIGVYSKIIYLMVLSNLSETRLILPFLIPFW